MTLAKDERIFLLILIVNLIISLIYLLAGILFVVPARFAMEDKEGCLTTGGPIFFGSL